MSMREIPVILWKKFRVCLPHPVANAVQNLAVELGNWVLHGIGVRRVKKFLKSGPSFTGIEFTGRARVLDNFINVGWETKFPIDLRRKLPFKDNSVEKIYSSHFLEHLYPFELEMLLKECHRILKDGGVFEAALPDVVGSILNYADYCRGVVPKFTPKIIYSSYRCPTEGLVYSVFCDYKHYNIYALDNLTMYFIAAGFKNLRTREYDPNIDLEKRKDSSFYIIAVKSNDN